MIKKDAKKSCWLKTQGRNLKYNYCTDAILSQEVRGPPHPVLGHLADVQVGCGQLLDCGGSRPVKGGKSFTEPQSILLLVQDCLGWDCEQLGWEIFARYSGWQLKFPFLNCIFRSYLFLFRSTSSSRGRLTGPCAGSTPRRPPSPRGSLCLTACRGFSSPDFLQLIIYWVKNRQLGLMLGSLSLTSWHLEMRSVWNHGFTYLLKLLWMFGKKCFFCRN